MGRFLGRNRESPGWVRDSTELAAVSSKQDRRGIRANRAQTKGSQRVPQSLVSSKTSSVNDNLIFWLDAPQTWNRRTRWVTLAGWCVWRSGPPLRAIRATIRGHVFETRLFHDRADVIQHCGVSADQIRCGFSLEVRLARGGWPLCIEASNGTGGYCIVWHKNVVGPIFLSAAERRQRRRSTQVA